ncbi:hypothetical protein LAC03_14790 [Levilactobacillus acidifarinae]|nr:hypothetical protein LAC03_14790 [Levilactobacillus acidifarinae]
MGSGVKFVLVGVSSRLEPQTQADLQDLIHGLEAVPTPFQPVSDWSGSEFLPPNEWLVFVRCLVGSVEW